MRDWVGLNAAFILLMMMIIKIMIMFMMMMIVAMPHISITDHSHSPCRNIHLIETNSPVMCIDLQPLEHCDEKTEVPSRNSGREESLERPSTSIS